MYQSEAFQIYLLRSGKTENTCKSYRSYLIRADREIGGLDEIIQRDGRSSVYKWADNFAESSIDGHRKDIRSAVRSYLAFVETEGPVEPVELEAPAPEPGLAFRLEHEMQSAVRKQLNKLSPGLLEADDGYEQSVSTGRIDIVARRANGRMVVIELKAGICPPGSIEQALGYAQALSEENNEEVDVIVIASRFPNRIRAAAKRINGLELYTYDFDLSFQLVE